jgi:hypothetical protein
MSSIVSASIDLTKIEESKIIEKNGKRWLNLTISINDATDTYGNNASVSINQSVEERTAKAPKTYLGNAKVIWTDGKIIIAEKKVAF